MWPTLEQYATYLRLTSPFDDAVQQTLDAAISYGTRTGGDAFATEVPDDVFQACLDYAGSLYMERIGQSDQFTDPVQGSTPQQRYRRIILSARMVGFA